MFSLACNLMISRKNFLAKRPCGCNLIRSNQRAGSANTLKHFHMENYQNEISKWPDIKDDDQRCQLVRRYGVSKTSVSFGCQLKRLCDVLSWSVSLRYQLVPHYDVSNRSVLFTYQWNITRTSQIGLTNWRTSCDVTMMSQHGLKCSN